MENLTCRDQTRSFLSNPSQSDSFDTHAPRFLCAYRPCCDMNCTLWPVLRHKVARCDNSCILLVRAFPEVGIWYPHHG